MKRLLTFVTLFFLAGSAWTQGVGINETGADPNSSAGLDVDFNDKGFLPPRMTTAERDAIASPAKGLMIYNTDLDCLQYNKATSANPNWICSDGTNESNPPFICGTSTVTFTYKDQSVSYGTVERNYGNGNVKCWLDRNLGATQVATSSTDANSYGDLFQWGRGDDGHQNRNSGMTSTLSSTDNPGNPNFILAPNSPYDWRADNNNNRWNANPMVNNPCPGGWRVPTDAELDAERASWGANQNATGAINSPLKLPMAGGRSFSNGALGLVGTYGFYWSNAVSGSFAEGLRFYSDASMQTFYRADGYSVRCVKD